MRKRNPFRRNLAWPAWCNNVIRWHGEICDAVDKLPSPQREEFNKWDANRTRGVATSDWPGFEHSFVRGHLRLAVHERPHPLSANRGLPLPHLRFGWSLEGAGFNPIGNRHRIKFVVFTDSDRGDEASPDPTAECVAADADERHDFRAGQKGRRLRRSESMVAVGTDWVSFIPSNTANPSIWRRLTRNDRRRQRVQRFERAGDVERVGETARFMPLSRVDKALHLRLTTIQIDGAGEGDDCQGDMLPVRFHGASTLAYPPSSKR